MMLRFQSGSEASVELKPTCHIAWVIKVFSTSQACQRFRVSLVPLGDSYDVKVKNGHLVVLSWIWSVTSLLSTEWGKKKTNLIRHYLVFIQDELREADHVRDGPGFVDGRPPRLLVHPVPVKNQPRRCLKVHRVKKCVSGIFASY